MTSTSIPSITATWMAPSSGNGEPAFGYKLYIDDGFGGAWRLVFDGS